MISTLCRQWRHGEFSNCDSWPAVTNLPNFKFKLVSDDNEDEVLKPTGYGGEDG